MGTEESTRISATSQRSHGLEGLKIKVAGFGGQGVLLLGQLLTEMGVREGLEASWLPSYGPEMRSGSAHCHVCLSRNRIGSPVVSQPDVLIAMNELSLRKFASQVSERGLILYNGAALPQDFVPPLARVACIPAAEIADKLGFAKAANIVLLGALLEETGCRQAETALDAIGARVKKAGVFEVNRKAFEEGRKFVDQNVWVGPESQADGFAN